MWIYVYLTYKTSYSISGRHRLMRKLQVRWIDKLEIYSTWQVLFLQKPRKPAQRQTPFRMTRTHQYEKNTQPTVHQRKYPLQLGSNLPPPPKQIKLRLHSSLDFLNWFSHLVGHLRFSGCHGNGGASLVTPSPSCQYSSWSLDLIPPRSGDERKMTWILHGFIKLFNRMNTIEDVIFKLSNLYDMRYLYPGYQKYCHNIWIWYLFQRNNESLYHQPACPPPKRPTPGNDRHQFFFVGAHNFTYFGVNRQPQLSIWGWTLKWWFSPTTIGFPYSKMTILVVFWGYHHFRKHWNENRLHPATWVSTISKWLFRFHYSKSVD